MCLELALLQRAPAVYPACVTCFLGIRKGAWICRGVCVCVCVCVCELVTQLCSILCDPMDCRPSGSSVPGISQARLLSGLPFPSPGDRPNPGLNPNLRHCRQILYQLSYQGNPELSGLLLTSPDMCLGGGRVARTMGSRNKEEKRKALIP